jgi:hypothetical protein
MFMGYSDIADHFQGQNINYWLVVDLPPEKYEFVSWDDEIPNLGKIKHVPNHQPD